VQSAETDQAKSLGLQEIRQIAYYVPILALKPAVIVGALTSSCGWRVATSCPFWKPIDPGAWIGWHSLEIVELFCTFAFASICREVWVSIRR